MCMLHVHMYMCMYMLYMLLLLLLYAMHDATCHVTSVTIEYRNS